MSELKHYGILGMRWGVRRYQPYSTTGPRKSGKTGKEIGLAAKMKSANKSVKNAADSLYKKALSKYRNEDGTLTDLGRKAYYQDSKITQRAKTEKDFSKYGVIKDKVTSNGVEQYRIKKGSKMQRVTNKNEALSNKRKYVSITDSDNEAYDELWDELDMKRNPNNKDNAVRVDTYEAKKDLKVAPAKMVVNYMLTKYGDQTVNDLLSKDIGQYSKSFDETLGKVLKQEGNTKIKDIVLNMWDNEYNYKGSYQNDMTEEKDFSTRFSATRYAAARLGTMRFVQQLSANQKNGNSKLSKDVFETFAKRGYDAVVDAEDARYFDLPIVLLNPVDSVKRTDTRKHSWAGKY